MDNKQLAGTFTPNRIEPIHGWYGYIEGYSSGLVENELDLLSDKKIESIYDPFGGTGTTLLAASMRGIKPYYSETNPFMNAVTQTKINDVIAMATDTQKLEQLEGFYLSIENCSFKKNDVDVSWGGFEKYYSNESANLIIKIKKRINKIEDETVKNVLMLALSAVAVECSKMIRRGDLRFAKEREKLVTPDVKSAFLKKLKIMIEDIKNDGVKVLKEVTPLARDSRDINEKDLVDCVITSPPYLNGTNYIRNTKLELKINDYVNRESDLAGFHSKGIIAGINNVSKRNSNIECLPNIQKYIDALNPVSYDKRIQLMVAGYFYNMDQMFQKLHDIIRNEGIFIMDIGDSQFAGIHIPTHQVLAELCESHGFRLYDEEILRTRYSKNGMKLTQRVLRFRLCK